MNKVAPSNMLDLSKIKISEEEKEWIRQAVEKYQVLDQLSSTSQTTNISSEGIFNGAEQFLSAIVSLGVVAGLLAGTSLATVALPTTDKQVSHWIMCMSLVSCSVAIAVAMIVSFVYYTGYKLLSRENLMVSYFIKKSSWIRFVAVRGFILASCLQVGALILISVEKVLAGNGTELVPSAVAITLMLSTILISLYLIHYLTNINRKCKKAAQLVRSSYEATKKS